MTDRAEDLEEDFEGEAGDELTEDELNDDLLLEAMVKKQLPATVAFAMCERLEEEPALRERLARIVSSQAVLASIIDPKLRPTTPACDVAQAGFAPYENGTMPQAEIGPFSAHLQACSLCQLGFEAFQMRASAADDAGDDADDADDDERHNQALEDRLLAALRASPARGRSRWRIAGLSAAAVAIGLGFVALGRWGFDRPAAALGVVAQAAGSGALPVARPADAPPELAAAVAELLIMHPWPDADRVVLAQLADSTLGTETRDDAISRIMLSGFRAPENLAWALAACEPSPRTRAVCYGLLKAGGAVISLDAGQALRALDRELAAGDDVAAGMALDALARAATRANVRPIFIDLLARAATAPATFVRSTGVSHRALDTFAGDPEIRAGVAALTDHADARVRVSALGDLLADAVRMNDEPARAAFVRRVGPYLVDAAPKVASAARLTIGTFANEADLMAILAVVGPSPPPGWDTVCATVAARATLLSL